MSDLTPELLVYGFISYVVFLFSTTCHEASHALVAKLGGDTTAARQVTLNPIPHIQREPWGMVVIPILAFLFSHSMIPELPSKGGKGRRLKVPSRRLRENRMNKLTTAKLGRS